MTLSSLAQMAELSRQANAHGLDPEDALALTAAAQDTASVRDQARTRSDASAQPLKPQTQRQPRIAIIGAGISGMTAAMTLKDAGFSNITVYEASDHVGGRVLTETALWAPDQWSEYGGELIDSDHVLIHQLCRRFSLVTADLETLRPPSSSETFYFNGKYYSWAQMLEDWREAKLDAVLAEDVETLPEDWRYDADWSEAALALDAMSAWEYIESRVPGGHASTLGQLLDVAYAGEYGEETSRQSALDVIGLLGFPNPNGFYLLGSSDERYRIIGGNQQIALAQADYLGEERIHLGMHLVALIDDGSAGFTLEFAFGQSVQADEVVLALPLGVMKHILADGGFNRAFDDARKHDSIKALGFGANSKLQLQLDNDENWIGNGPWGCSNGAAYADTGFQNAWSVSSGQPGRQAIINNYTGGDSARAFTPTKPFATTADHNPKIQAEVAAAARTFLAQVEPVFPGLGRKWTGVAALSVWHLNPFAYGSYSYWTPGYMHKFAGYEAKALGRLHFAGEHTSTEFQGYIEGAAEEGERAANEIIASYI